MPYDPVLDALKSVGRRRKPAEFEQEQDPESFFSKSAKALGGGALNGISAVGNILDLPGSSVRDLLGGENPIDQWHPANWTSSENRLGGRDLLRKHGLVGDEDTWGNWAGGLAAEIALDPTTYLNPFPIGPAGKIAKAAGLLDDAAKVAARKSGVAAGLVGKRVAHMKTNLGDLIQEGGQAAQDAVGAYAKTNKIDLTPELLKQPLGGTLGFGLPFTDHSSHIIGTGPMAQKFAGALDTLGRTARFAKVPGTDFQPINDTLNLFDSTANGAKSPEELALAQDGFRTKAKNDAAAKLATAQTANEQRLHNADVAKRAFALDGPERTRFVKQATEAFPETAAENIATMDARAKEMISRAEHPDINTIDDFYKGKSVVANSDPSSLPSGAMLQRPGDVTNTPEFKNWFGASKIVDEAGKPKKVYHGTSAGGFEAFDDSKHYANGDLLFGPGTYLTDSKEIADSYTKLGKGAAPKNYEMYASLKNPFDTSKQVGRGEFKRLLGGLESTGAKVNVVEDLAEGADHSVIAEITLPPTRKNELPTTFTLDNFSGDSMGNGEELWRKLAGYMPAEKVNKALQAAGYDGIRYNGGAHLGGPVKHDAYVVFDPTNLKSTANRGTFDANNPNIYFQGDPTTDLMRNTLQGSMDDELRRIKGQTEAGAPLTGKLKQRISAEEAASRDLERAGGPAWSTRYWKDRLDEANAKAGEIQQKKIDSLTPEGEFGPDAWKHDMDLEHNTRHAEFLKSKIAEAEAAAAKESRAAFGKKAKLKLTDEMRQDIGPNTLFQDGAAEQGGFYSKLDRVVADKVKGKVSADQLLATLKNNGVTDEEIRDRGLLEFLQSTGGVVKRNDLAKHLEANPAPQLKRTELGGASPEPRLISKERTGPDSGRLVMEVDSPTGPRRLTYNASRLEGGGWKFDVSPNAGGTSRTAADLDELNSKLTQSLKDHGDWDTRWEEYKVSGGDPGTYREHVFTLPEDKELATKISDLKAKLAKPLRGAEREQYRKELADASRGEYAHGHWQGFKNQAMHVRTDDVTLPGGKKILRINELQDDWAQAGRTNRERVLEDLALKDGVTKLTDSEDGLLEVPNPAFDEWIKANEHRVPADAGYRTGNVTTEQVADARSKMLIAKRRADAAHDAMDSWESAVPDDFYEWNKSKQREWYENYMDRAEDAKATTGDAHLKAVDEYEKLNAAANGLPNRPLKEGWAKHALRQMIDYATKNGYDGIGLVKGEDIARAVGGPPEELGKFYDEILANELKGLTKAKPFTDNAIAPGSRALLAGSSRKGDMQVFDLAKVKDKVLKEGQPIYQTGASSPRGAVVFNPANPGEAVIHAFKAKNASTFAHETGHVFRRTLDPELMKRAADDLKVADIHNWTREEEEAFATHYERYLHDGKAPTAALQSVFKKFKEWMLNVYRGITGTPIEKEVSPELRKVFDEMLGGGARAGAKPKGTLTDDLLRQMMEIPGIRKQVMPTLSDPLQHLLGKMRTELDSQPGRATDLGIPLSQNSDPLIASGEQEHFPRHMPDGAAGPSSPFATPSKPFDVKTPEMKQRRRFLKGIPGATEAMKPAFADPALNDLLDNGGSSKDAAAFLQQNYSHVFPPTFTTKSGKQADRFRAVGAMLHGMPSEVRRAGVFGNTPLADFERANIGFAKSESNAKAVADFLGQKGILQDATATKGTASVAEVLKSLNLKEGDYSQGFLKEIFKHLANRGVVQDISTIKNLRVRNDLAEGLVRQMSGGSVPEAVKGHLGVFDRLTNAFKAGVTSPWPAFHGRNLVGAGYTNLAEGTASPRAYLNTKNILHGQVVPGAEDIPAVQAAAKNKGLNPANLTHEQATEVLREIIAAHEVTGPGQGIGADVVDGVAKGTTQADLLDRLPGNEPFSFGDLAKTAAGTPSGWLNPKVRGVRGDKTTLPPLAAGEKMGNYVEGYNRIAPFIEQLRRGVDPFQAAETVRKSQVGYAGKHYTPFERNVMTRVAPFYKFSSGQARWAANELATHPGGRLAQTIRAARSGQDPNEPLPEYISDTTAVPVDKNGLGAVLGTPADGSKRYLTGLGLPFEDTLQFAGKGPQDVALEALGRGNPLLTYPLELATGQVFFQRGPDGGRPIEDTDPLLGRIASNVAGGTEPKRFYGDRQLDQLIAHSPASRAVTTLRTATDPRKRNLGGLANLATGVRVSDVSPAAQDRVLRDRAQQLMREMGGKVFSRAFVPEGRKADMMAAERAKLKEYEALLKELEQRAKARKAG